MMKQEFENIIDGEISNEDYQKIEIVYMWYPGVESKEQIAELYKIGMTLINDLFPRANEIVNLTSKMNEIQKQIQELEK